MTVTVVYLWEKHRLIDVGGVFKGDELHVIPLLGAHRLSRNYPADGGHGLSQPGPEVSGAHIIQGGQFVLAHVQGVDGKIKPQDLGFMFQHQVPGIGDLLGTATAHGHGRSCFIKNIISPIVP